MGSRCFIRDSEFPLTHPRNYFINQKKIAWIYPVPGGLKNVKIFRKDHEKSKIKFLSLQKWNEGPDIFPTILCYQNLNS